MVGYVPEVLVITGQMKQLGATKRGYCVETNEGLLMSFESAAQLVSRGDLHRSDLKIVKIKDVCSSVE